MGIDIRWNIILLQTSSCIKSNFHIATWQGRHDWWQIKLASKWSNPQFGSSLWLFWYHSSTARGIRQLLKNVECCKVLRIRIRAAAPICRKYYTKYFIDLLLAQRCSCLSYIELRQPLSKCFKIHYTFYKRVTPLFNVTRI